MKAIKRFIEKIFKHLYFSILFVFRIEFPAKRNHSGTDSITETENPSL